MQKPDLVLLHAPVNLDFRQKPIIYGPISDVIPSTPIFEMYPIGFVSIASHLEKNKIHTRIVNLANRMLQDPLFDVDSFISKLNPIAFGIDLHWLPHASGSLDLAKLIKRRHPTIPIIFGGLSATYFHHELIEYPFVDFVVRGDSTEAVVLQLLQRLKNNTPFEDVPNLTWKDNKDGIHFNAISHIPTDLNEVPLDYTYPVRSVLKYRDLSSILPFKNWLDYPITMALTCRGCTLDCISCGGSRYAYRNMCNRDKPAFRDPELVAKDIKSAQNFLNGPAFIIGDPFQASNDYAERLLRALKKEKISNPVVLEFFTPPPPDFFEKVNKAIPHYNVQLSAESHDEEVRRAFGKGYSNKKLEETIQNALKNGCERFDLFFMVGLSKQNYTSVLDTAHYCTSIMKEFSHEKKLHPMISPLAPFIDPGSKVYENPQKYGYHLYWKDLEEHCQALHAPTWKYMLSYETEWLTRDEIVESTYESAIILNKAKLELGLISSKDGASVDTQSREALSLIHAVDKAVKEYGPDFNREEVFSMATGTKHLNASTLCPKKELEWPASSILMSTPKILWNLIPRGGNNQKSG